MSDMKSLLARIAKLEKELATAKGKRRNVNGGSREVDRGTWCTPKEWADRIGPVDVDLFSNPRSHITALVHLMLERGDDALAGPRRGEYFVAPTGDTFGPGEERRFPTACGRRRADENTRTFIQPPYTIVLDAIANYGHTRFCALLRFDPSTEWFSQLYRLSALVCVPRRKRIEFEPPPGVPRSSNPYPHALFYKHAEDATEAVLRACIAWRPR